MDTIEKAILKELAAKHRGSRVRDPLLCLIALLPVICLAWLISATVVNVLILDEWDHIFLFRHLAAHTLTLSDLFQQHNETRPALPNLIMLGLGVLTRWDTRWDMGVTFLFACVISVNVYLLSRRTMNRQQALILWAVANVLIFSTEQSQNWSWGIQMIVFMPIMLIFVGILVAYSRMNVTWKFVMCMVLSTAATFSYANGQLAWVLLLAALVIGSRKQTRRLGWRIWMWAAAFAANMWVYYRDYQVPPDNPSMLLVLKHPVQAMEYFAAFLGASLGQGFHRLWISVAFGAVLLACLAGICQIVWHRRRQATFAEPASIWLLIAAYSMMSAAVATVGRLGFGVNQSQDSRYTTFSLYLVVGLLYLGAMIVRDIHRRGETVSARVLACLGLGLLLLPQTVTQLDGYRQMWAYHRGCLTGKACVQLINISVIRGALPYPTPEKIIEEVGFLDQMGYLSPGLVKRDISLIEGNANGKSYGCFEALKPLPGDAWSANGWAIDPKHVEQAAIVILAGENSQGVPQAFAVATVGGPRPDVSGQLHHRAYATCGWNVRFKAPEVPLGTKMISAWAYNPISGLAYRLTGHFRWESGGAGL